MSKDGFKSRQIAQLRQRVEQFLRENPKIVQEIPPQKVEQLVKELHLCQAQLEIQTKELDDTKIQLELIRKQQNNVKTTETTPRQYHTTDEKLIGYQRQLRSLAVELSLAEDRQRRQLAGDLHDSTGQTLTLARIKLKVLQNQVRPERCKQQLTEISELINKAIQDIQTLIFELSPPILHTLGLAAAINWLTEQTSSKHKINCTFKQYGKTDRTLGTDCRAILFRAARELLANVIKHAKADNASIKLYNEEQILIITVEDDGKGFDPEKLRENIGHSTGFGLLGIRERLSYLQGNMIIDSQNGGPTRITLIVPLIPENGDEGALP